MEDIAKSFLNELIRRSLIQVVRTLWEKVSKCRIHDLLRDLAVQKASEIIFLTFMIQETTPYPPYVLEMAFISKVSLT